MDYKNIILSTEITGLEFERGGREFTIPVKVQNGSGVDLFAQNLFITYHILNLDGKVLRWDNERTKLFVKSEEEVVLDVAGAMLNEAGEFYLEIDIVKEGVEWYSAKGMDVIAVPVTVFHRGSKYRDLLEKEIQRQEEIERGFYAILESGEYQMQNPYIQLNPYGNSPLAAIVVFTTEKPMRFSVRVEGKTKETDVMGDFSEYTQEHILPIYGLYPDFLNTVILMGKTKFGMRQVVTLQIQTEPLEGDFGAINLCTYIGELSKYEPGVNFCYTGLENKGMKYAYDIYGDIRWYLSETFAEPANYHASTSVWVMKQEDEVQSLEELEGILYEYSLLGRIMSAFIIPFWIHHEILLTKETLYVFTHSADTANDVVVEINRNTGEVLHYFNYKEMFMRTRNTSEVYSNKDWLHMNAVLEHEGDIIVSGNTQSTIMKHDKQGKIKWILADPIGYTTFWKKLALTPIGENFDFFYNQHAIEILPDIDGNPDTFDMLVFDNGDSRNKCNGLDKREYPPYSRVVQYRINERNRTVEQIWEYGKERKELYSMWRGDANLHANGNILGVFNIRDKNDIDEKRYMESCVCVEVDRKKNIIWESYGCSDRERNSYQNYRMDRKEMYDVGETNVDLSHKVKIVEVWRRE